MLAALRKLFQTEHDWAHNNLSAYLDEMLEGEPRSRLERHLGECAACRTELEGLRRTVSLLRLVPEVPLPRSFLVPLSEARSQAVPQRAWGFPVMRTASVVASFLLVVVLSGNLAFRAGYLGAASAPQAAPEVMMRGAQEPLEAQGLPPAAAVAESTPKMAVVRTVQVEKEIVVEAPSTEPAEALKSLETEPGAGGGQEIAEKAPSAKPEPALESPGFAAMGKEAPAATLEASAPSEEHEGATETMPAEAAFAAVAPSDATPADTLVAAAKLPTAVVEQERTIFDTVATQRDVRSDAREKLGAALDGAMWALLLTTVALWAVTALFSRQRR